MSADLREKLYSKVAKELGIEESIVRKVAESQWMFLEEKFDKVSLDEVTEINLFCFGKFTSLENKLQRIREYKQRKAIKQPSLIFL